MIKKINVLAFVCFFCAFLPQKIDASVKFSGLDLNVQNKLLFAASSDNPWQPEYKSIFSTNLDGKNVQILSCFPEKMELLEEGRTLQIRNWFGVARFTSENASLKWTSQNPLFERGKPMDYNPPVNMSVSPDGNWTVHIRKKSVSVGELVLTDEVNDVSTVIVSNAVFSADNVPVKWAPDSSYLIYENNNKLLFAEPSMFFEKTRISEKYRTIADGNINNVYWVSDEFLVYVTGKDLFKVRKNELYTRAMYSSVIGSGTIIGQLPVKFDNKRDSFWMNSTGSAVLFVQNNKNVWMYELSSLKDGKTAFVAPFVNLPEQVTSVKTFWNNQDLPIVWVEYLCGGKSTTLAFKMNRTENRNGSIQYHVASVVVPQDATNPVLSPDKKLLAYKTNGKIKVVGSQSWAEVATFDGEEVNTFLWAKNDSLFVGGYETIRSWNINTNVHRVLFLSSAKDFGWSQNGQNILAFSAGKTFVFNQSTGLWNLTNESVLNTYSVQNDKARVYLDSSKNGYFENAIYVRKTGSSVQTYQLFAEPEASVTGAFVKTKPRVTLAFDALDSDSGLTEILNSLYKNNVKATFFLNGEFIRRYPVSVQEITAGGHQCGSMFFTDMDLTNPEYNINEEFVLNGLARNEDDYFNVTGTDLSLIWHTPQYITNSLIEDAGKKAGYEFVRQDIAPADWVSLEDSAFMPTMYKSSTELLEWVTSQVRNYSVISINVGLSNGQRTDYLYEYLDELIAALITAGYDIVPYSELYLK